MTKISFLAVLAFASVCSALELYVDHGFEGDDCIIATPSRQCVEIPEPCLKQVSSMKLSVEWRCYLYDDGYCRGRKRYFRGDNYPSLGVFEFDDKAISAYCWIKGPYENP
ncbi:MAG: hypothetical protein J3Q66DRAFT_191793 [Benniella sp.]|nr:MAG: hypothetical protein J3Q66DRAFT_191793 [Benniella sp.]